MTRHGYIHKGAIVLAQPLELPEGSQVEVEVTPVKAETPRRRDLARLAEGIKYDFTALERLRGALEQ